MLALEIDFLTGSIVASRDPEDQAADFPPQPDRVYSALVASWGARGCDPREREALEWLERQPPPLLVAAPLSDSRGRKAPITFVPPNDAKTSTDGSFDVLPARRQKQPRRFASGYLSDPTIRLVWQSDADSELRERLDALARDTAYVGHSMSLTRCRFVEGEFDVSDARSPKRTVYEGRLRDLEHWFTSGRRPQPGRIHVVPKMVPQAVVARATIFSDSWLVLSDDGGAAPDFLAAPVVCRTMRNAIMGAYHRLHGNLPEWLTGHSDDGQPSREPHLAVVPLADVGWEFSEGRLMGCALVLPRSVANDATKRLLELAVRELLENTDEDNDDLRIELHWGAKRPWYLVSQDVPQQASLRTNRWLGISRGKEGPRDARTWTTATPLVLDRFPKAKDDAARAEEVRQIIRSACADIGLPPPSQVEAHVTSFLRGAPAANRSRKAPQWQRWQLPPSLTGRYLTHATIGFEEPVHGPVIVGAGRFFGLGLCLPLDGRAS